ncbi:MAG: TlpA family protein disulfide reductase [Thermoanaerobaculia bacterium]|nr:TlpA family protein disulfide reductase [Thermoanaerobaculia bacterium]
MKSYFVAAFYFLFAATMFSQHVYYTQTNYSGDTLFPFTIPMLDIDSTKESNSKEVLAIPKKEKDRSPTVVAFWLTTCMPCHRELATYTANYAEWKKQANFNLYAISIDFPHNFRKIAQIVRNKQFPFPVYWDRDRLFRSVMPGGLNGLPQVFIFDKNGNLAYKHKGFRLGDEQELFAKIKELQ